MVYGPAVAISPAIRWLLSILGTTLLYQFSPRSALYLQDRRTLQQSIGKVSKFCSVLLILLHYLERVELRSVILSLHGTNAGVGTRGTGQATPTICWERIMAVAHIC